MSIICSRGLLPLVLLAAACSSGNEDVREWIGPGATEEDVVAALDELETALDAAFVDSGGDWLPYADLPTSAEVTYSGGMFGMGVRDSGPIVDYAANLELEVDFGSGDVSGEITNIATRLAGFDHPEGRIAVTGDVGDAAGVSWITFTGQGDVSQGDLAASYRLPEVYGGFAGSDAQAVGGYQATNFFWTDGPYAGTNSSSDGEFIAVRQ